MRIRRTFDNPSVRSTPLFLVQNLAQAIAPRLEAGGGVGPDGVAQPSRDESMLTCQDALEGSRQRRRQPVPDPWKMTTSGPDGVQTGSGNDKGSDDIPTTGVRESGTGDDD